MQKKTIYVVSYKHYGDDSYCSCNFQPIVAFDNLEDARKYAEEHDEYDYDDIELEEK